MLLQGNSSQRGCDGVPLFMLSSFLHFTLPLLSYLLWDIFLNSAKGQGPYSFFYINFWGPHCTMWSSRVHWVSAYGCSAELSYASCRYSCLPQFLSLFSFWRSVDVLHARAACFRQHSFHGATNVTAKCPGVLVGDWFPHEFLFWMMGVAQVHTVRKVGTDVQDVTRWSCCSACQGACGCVNTICALIDTVLRTSGNPDG